MATRRLLLCTHAYLTKTLGAAKPLLELADAVRPFGWDATVWGRDEVAPYAADAGGSVNDWYPRALRTRLLLEAGDFDVVDYDQVHLPFSRKDFAPNTLMVARSVLLLRHLISHRIPIGPSFRQRIGAILKARHRRVEITQAVALAMETIRAADLVNVTNRQDREILVHDGVDAEKIVVLPFGIGEDRRQAFSATSTAIPNEPPTIAFVGTFDYRKGGRDLPAILARLVDRFPKLRLRLLGTSGMFSTAEKVLAHFPPRLRNHVSVVTRFDPIDLPTLLSDCWCGVFPSYLEGFPFGVLEMLAAAVPVVAYDSPGPPEMLPPDWLVRVGDSAAMADLLLRWLTSSTELLLARRWARDRSAAFEWSTVAARTAEVYEEKLVALRSAIASPCAGVTS